MIKDDNSLSKSDTFQGARGLELLRTDEELFEKSLVSVISSLSIRFQSMKLEDPQLDSSNTSEGFYLTLLSRYTVREVVLSCSFFKK